MGLLSKIKSAAGTVKARTGSAIGALKASKIGAVGRRIAASPVGRIASKGSGMAGKVGTIVTIGSAVVSGAKALTKDKPKATPKPNVTSKGKPSSAGYNRLRQMQMIAMSGHQRALIAKSQPKPTLLERGLQWVKSNPVKTGLILAGVTAAGVAIYRKATSKPSKPRSKPRRKRGSSKRKPRRRRSTRRSSRSRTRRKRGYGTERQYKRKGGLDVKYTKNGQPYVIQANGRARFVKRSRR